MGGSCRVRTQLTKGGDYGDRMEESRGGDVRRLVDGSTDRREKGAGCGELSRSGELVKDRSVEFLSEMRSNLSSVKVVFILWGLGRACTSEIQEHQNVDDCVHIISFKVGREKGCVQLGMPQIQFSDRYLAVVMIAHGLTRAEFLVS